MSYYDNVKDEVNDSNDTSKPSFDTLREAAEENSESEEERQGDDTDIEVLEDGLGSDSGGSSSGIEEIGGDESDQTPSSQKSESREQRERKSAGSRQEPSVDQEAIEEKLDKIIEQNEEMIEVLKSFGS